MARTARGGDGGGVEAGCVWSPSNDGLGTKNRGHSGVTRNGTLKEYMLRDRIVGSHGATLLELVPGGETRDGPSRWNVKSMSRRTWQQPHASQ